MRISIQQPEFFPWLGFFDKMLRVDKIVYLDNIQFKKRYFENRNRVRTYEGWTWIVTPVITKGRYKQNINEVEIDNSRAWRKKLIGTIEHNYRGAPFWQELGPELCRIVMNPMNRLAELNLAVIQLMLKKMGLTTAWVLASSLNTQHHGSDLILEICEKMGAREYLSGRDGKEYLNLGMFEKKGISVHFQNFVHPIYHQFHGGFEQAMSVVDLYFNMGPKSIEVFKKHRESAA